jgi:hypothetical protein
VNRNLVSHDIEACYRDMAADQAREKEALEWSEAVIFYSLVPKKPNNDSPRINTDERG